MRFNSGFKGLNRDGSLITRGRRSKQLLDNFK